MIIIITCDCGSAFRGRNKIYKDSSEDLTFMYMNTIFVVCLMVVWLICYDYFIQPTAKSLVFCSLFMGLYSYDLMITCEPHRTLRRLLLKKGTRETNCYMEYCSKNAFSMFTHYDLRHLIKGTFSKSICDFLGERCTQIKWGEVIIAKSNIPQETIGKLLDWEGRFGERVLIGQYHHYSILQLLDQSNSPMISLETYETTDWR